MSCLPYLAGVSELTPIGCTRDGHGTVLPVLTRVANSIWTAFKRGAQVQLAWPNISISLENAVAAMYTRAFYRLDPLVRIDTVRPVLFSGDALPMRAFAAYS